MSRAKLSKRFLRDVLAGKTGLKRNQPYGLQIKRNDDGKGYTFNIVNSKWEPLSTIAEFANLETGESVFLTEVHRGFQMTIE